MPQTGPITARVQLLDTSGLVSYAGSTNTGIYIWGAQIEFEQYEHKLKQYIDEYRYIRTRGVTSTAITLNFEPDHRLDFIQPDEDKDYWFSKNIKLTQEIPVYSGNLLLWSERLYSSSWTTTAATLQTVNYASSWVITFRSNIIPRTTSNSSQAYDYAYGVAVDSAGNSYVAGRAYPPAAFTFKSSIAIVVKINSSGNIVWNRALGNNFTTGSTSLFHHTVLDSSETNVYALGYSVNAGQSNNPHIVRMRTSDGAVTGTTPVWSLTSDGSEYWRTGKMVGTDLYALGSLDQTNDGILMAKYSAAGNGALTWQRLYGNVPQVAFGFGLDIGASGNIYMGGQDNQSGNAVLVAMNSSPSILWQRLFNHTSTAIRTSSICYSVLCDRAEGVYTVSRGSGTDGFGGTYDLFVDKWNSSTGARIWSKRFGDSSGGNSTVGGAIDPDADYLYIAFRQDSLGQYATDSSNSQGTGIALVKMDLDGAVIWRRALTFRVGTGDEFRWIYNDVYGPPITVRGGYIYFTATNYTSLNRGTAEGGMMVLARFRTDGADLGDYGQYVYKDASLLIGEQYFTSLATTTITPAWGLSTPILTSTLTTVGAFNFNYESSLTLQYASGTGVETTPVTGLLYNASLLTNTSASVFGSAITGSSLLAQYLIHNTSNSQHSITQNVNLTPGVDYIASVWARTNHSSTALYISNGTSTLALFDLTAGLATGHAITAYANDWYRCATTFVATTSILTLGLWNNSSNTSIYAGSGTSSDSILLWGSSVLPHQSDNIYVRTQTTSTLSQNSGLTIVGDSDLAVPLSSAVKFDILESRSDSVTAAADRRKIPGSVTVDANRVAGLELIKSTSTTFSLGLYTPADGDNVYYEAWDWFSEADLRTRARQAQGRENFVRFIDMPIYESRSVPRNAVFDAGQVSELFDHFDTDVVIDQNQYSLFDNQPIQYDKYSWYTPVPRSDWGNLALGNHDGVGVAAIDNLGWLLIPPSKFDSTLCLDYRYFTQGLIKQDNTEISEIIDTFFFNPNEYTAGSDYFAEDYVIII